MRARKNPGQALVELAIAVPVLLWFALGTLDFGRVFYASVGLNSAVHEGARVAAALQLTCDGTSLPPQVRTTVRTTQDDLFPASIPDSVIHCPVTAADRRTVSIVGYPFQPFTPFIATALGNGTVIPLSASATMPVVNG